MRFEWDKTRKRGNVEDHGVDFKDADVIFEGAFPEATDRRGEPRFQALVPVNDDDFVAEPS
jgi:uncharacterized DUF497 family protein